MEFVCFCGEKAKSFQCKNGESIFTCGQVVDFKKMREVLKMKASPEKDKALQKLDLGCNMRLKRDELCLLQEKLDDIVMERKHIPKCEHQLFARLGISSSFRNNERLYFSCNVKVPDIPCSYFKWFDEYDEPEQSKKSKRKCRDEEEEEEEEEEETVKYSKPKLSRKKQKLV